MFQVSPVLTLSNWAWLKALNSSTRSCRRRFFSASRAKFLKIEKSLTLMPGLLM